jgi:D-amino-acid dehydrogenase
VNNDVIIIGGGISALMNAYYLNKANIKVTIIDKDSNNIKNKTSFGNAGLLSAFGKTPLSHPGIFTETIKLLLQKKSPLYITSIPNIKTILWAIKFFTPIRENTLNTMKLFEKYGQESLNTYNYMQTKLNIDLEYHQEGFVNVFNDINKYNKTKDIFKNNPNITSINKDMIENIYPILNIDKISGALLLKQNAHINPQKILINLKKYLQEKGVIFIDNEEIIDIEKENNKIKSVISKTTKYIAKEYIIATGINTDIAQKLDTNLIQIPTKGYSITFNMDKKLIPKIPIMLSDKFAILTPRKDDIRITSNLEIGSINPNIDKQKITNLISIIKSSTKDFEIKDIQPWCGFRALPPDDKPLLGRDKKYKNVIYSMGLGWLGITFGSSIANMVSSLIINDIDNESQKDIMAFSGLIK